MLPSLYERLARARALGCFACNPLLLLRRRSFILRLLSRARSYSLARHEGKRRLRAPALSRLTRPLEQRLRDRLLRNAHGKSTPAVPSFPRCRLLRHPSYHRLRHGREEDESRNRPCLHPDRRERHDQRRTQSSSTFLPPTKLPVSTAPHRQVLCRSLDGGERCKRLHCVVGVWDISV